MIQGACGLDTNWAKAISYYALATHGLPNLKKFPILLLEGPPGTGKSTILGILGQITNGPSRIDGSVSRAELRDSLNGTHTAFIEEADRVSERLVRNRYSDHTSRTVVKRKAPRGWNREPLDLFGATVLHRRVPFKDPAVQSRGITVHTRKADGRLKSDLDAFTPYQDYLASLATEIKWEQAVDLGGGQNSGHLGTDITGSPALSRRALAHMGDERDRPGRSRFRCWAGGGASPIGL